MDCKKAYEVPRESTKLPRAAQTSASQAMVMIAVGRFEIVTNPFKDDEEVRK